MVVINKMMIKFSNSTTFLAACACNDFDECERLLSHNLVNINCTNIDGLTALHQACIDDNMSMVEFLLDHGADVNCCDNEGWTPLHATASCGNKNIARLLLERGADPRIVNNDGELAQDLTDCYAIEEMIDFKLKELGVTDVDSLRKQEQICMLRDVNNWLQTGVVEDKIHPRTGATILHVAAAKGYIDVLESLLNNKVLRNQLHINARDNEGWTPLAAACYWQQSGAVQLLILHGADVNVETSSGQRLEDLTDHDLILELIEGKRKKLAEEIKLREQTTLNGPQSKVPPSPHSAPTPPTESETQRKANAKKVRESRRSTTGVSVDDVIQAKEQLKQATIASIASNEEPLIEADSRVSKLFDNIVTHSYAPTLSRKESHELPHSEGDYNLNSKIKCDSPTTPTTPTTPLTSSNPSTPTSQISATETEFYSRCRNSLIEQPFISSNNIEPSQQKTSLQQPQPQSSDPSFTDVANLFARRRRTRKRSSGTDIADDIKDQSSSENENVAMKNDVVDSFTVNLRDFSSTKPLINDENKYPSSTTTSGSTPSLHVRSRSTNRQQPPTEKDDVLLKESNTASTDVDSTSVLELPQQKKDYKKLYEELLVEMENLRKEYQRKEQEWTREKRHLQRKLSELEEEVKQLETLKNDNQRLKDENAALIRVISKLSK